ncbi:ChuX/HutX family heme-like substrate-binding protein [Thiomicrospira sp. R3]|uniref:ChuX/HutX family heme-like substrate-binding protein n=1 Tax=Thiomicrospira sp. R3 TaxID=3035472 RepID=UPI00259B87A9|nr:ChuX/HutX family heme-like substrate-binding protein [Thiomicrospira sp. R3]WFE69466.1 ChuX/HutX family heme-like substrate-binding protein [Thiomicrospira sp. R3]
MQLDELILQKQALLQSKQPVRARNAAEKMGISEAQYVALSLGDSVKMLDMTRLEELFNQLEALGELMALTRNNEVVIERKGIYQKPQVHEGAILLVNNDINLRLKVSEWALGFAVEEKGRHSLQFFDKQGIAAHKIYATELTRPRLFNELVVQFCLTDAMPRLLDPATCETPNLSESTKVDSTQVDSQTFQQAWRNLHDAHRVNALLNEFGLTRLQAYSLLSKEDAQKLGENALKSLFTQAAEGAIPLMIFVSNRCATQIFTGHVHKLLETGPWFNVLDPGFDLHMSLAGINQAWWVKKHLKPTDSDQTAQATYSVEFFNQQGEVVMFIYLKPEAKKETTLSQKWQELVLSLV